MEAQTCLFSLKITKWGKNTNKFSIENKLKIKFHSEPVYEYKHLKTKVREYDGVIKTNFLGNGIPKENMHYTCIACITINSVLKMDKRYFSQVYLQECNIK